VTAPGGARWRIGVIGAGQAGERQALGFAAHPDAAVVGVADLDPTRAEALAARVGGRAVGAWQDLFDLGLDVLVVATPHHLHVAPTEAAAARGVHVMMEKPLATTLADADRIVAVARDAGIRLATSFVHRFREESVQAKRFVGAAGPLQVGRETMATRRTPAHPKWLTNATMAGGGVLMYSAIHGVDRLRWFFADEVVEVVARTRRYTGDHDEVEDGVAALLTFAGGGAATLTANAPTYPADPAVWETEVHGRDAMVRMRTRFFAETNGKAGAQRYEAGGDQETARPHYNFERQAVDFLAAVEAGRDPSVTGEDGLRALEICLAVYRSAASGRPIAIDELRQGGTA
jgi:UDP-N-acetyl-2-amino-2-deoxyglucuronate dehydrogenase